MTKNLRFPLTTIHFSSCKVSVSVEQLIWQQSSNCTSTLQDVLRELNATNSSSNFEQWGPFEVGFVAWSAAGRALQFDEQPDYPTQAGSLVCLLTPWKVDSSLKTLMSRYSFDFPTFTSLYITISDISNRSDTSWTPSMSNPWDLVNNKTSPFHLH